MNRVAVGSYPVRSAAVRGQSSNYVVVKLFLRSLEQNKVHYVKFTRCLVSKIQGQNVSKVNDILKFFVHQGKNFQNAPI